MSSHFEYLGHISGSVCPFADTEDPGQKRHVLDCILTGLPLLLQQ